MRIPSNRAWSVYIVKCSDGTLYTGIALDVPRRIRQHNGELRGGSKYTSTRRPVVLQYAEVVGTRSAASKREYEIKDRGRDYKLQLIGAGEGIRTPNN